MKMIEKMSNMMEEEMQDAEKYIKCALKLKEDDVVLAKMFSDLSLDELKHAMTLHDNATRVIADYRSKGNEVPADMQAVYNYLHDKHLEKFNEIKLMQAMFRG